MSDGTAEHHDGAARVVEWMMRDGRHLTHMREFGDEMCRRIVATGIPLWRAFCSVGTLHPQIAATAYIWRRNTPGAVRFTADHSFANDPEFTGSPIAEVQRTGIMIRRRLHDPACALDYPALGEFKSDGGTDYPAMPIISSRGQVNCITCLTNTARAFKS